MGFEVGERVWVRLDPTQPWWPALVVLPEVLGVALPPSMDLCVSYYPDRASYDFIRGADPHVVQPFEDSSEKASTTDEALLRAIDAARQDDTALPLRTDFLGTAARQKRPRDAAEAGAGAPTRPVRSRRRAADTAPASFSAVPDDTVAALTADVRRGLTESNLVDTRRALVAAARTDVSLEQLHSTRLGEVVGAVYEASAMRPLHPLARALLSQYVAKLPAETRRAMRHLRRETEAQSNGSTAPEPAAVWEDHAAPASTRQAPPAAPISEDYPRRLAAALALPVGDPPLDSPRPVADVVSEFLRLPAHLRIDVEEVLSNAEHVDLRRRLLAGTLRPAAWESLTDEARTTPSERQARAQRFDDIAERERQEAVESQEAMLSTQFKCDSCQQRQCTYRQVQIRSGDEPMTIFVTCRNCNNTWTEN